MQQCIHALFGSAPRFLIFRVPRHSPPQIKRLPHTLERRRPEDPHLEASQGGVREVRSCSSLLSFRADKVCKLSRISNETGRCQEFSSSFFGSLNPLVFSIEHTRTLALERFPGRISFRRRSLSVSPYALSPCSFIPSVLPTKHLFDPGGP